MGERMLEIVAASLICLSTFGLLRDGMVGPGLRARRLIAIEGDRLILALLCVALAVLIFGPLAGGSMVLAVALHEFGHIVAYRTAGHSDARFRLLPLLGGGLQSDRLPAEQDVSFFVLLMGAGLSIAPVVLTRLMADLLHDPAPELSYALYLFSVIAAAMNFFSLLPFWPLDGAKCLRHLAAPFWPGSVRQLSIAMAAAAFVAALAMQSVVLVLVALIGLQGLSQATEQIATQAPMARRRAALAGAAYLAVGAAHLSAAWPLIHSIL